MARLSTQFMQCAGGARRGRTCGAGRIPALGLIITLWAGLATPADGIVIRHDVPVAGYAALAEQEAFRGLVGVSSGRGIGGRRGSGVLLNDEWVLTAAHLVWEQAVTSLQVRWEGQFRVIDSVHFAAGWVGDPAVGLGQGSDLALLRLASPVGLGRETGLASGGLLGETAVLLGTGRGGNGLIGAFLAGGGALGAMNVIDRQLAVGAGGLLVTDFDGGRSNQNALESATVDRRHYDDGFVNPLLSQVLLDGGGSSEVGFAGRSTAGDLFVGLPDEFLEGTTAAGDSGGPWFVRNTAGRWELAGVTSWGVNPLLPDGFARTDSRYGDLSFATDVSAHREWIVRTIPEPSGSVLACGGVLAGLARRRRAVRIPEPRRRREGRRGSRRKLAPAARA